MKIVKKIKPRDRDACIECIAAMKQRVEDILRLRVMRGILAGRVNHAWSISTCGMH
jgi:hypothetical protein